MITAAIWMSNVLDISCFRGTASTCRATLQSACRVKYDVQCQRNISCWLTHPIRKSTFCLRLIIHIEHDAKHLHALFYCLLPWSVSAHSNVYFSSKFYMIMPFIIHAQLISTISTFCKIAVNWTLPMITLFSENKCKSKECWLFVILSTRWFSLSPKSTIKSLYPLFQSEMTKSDNCNAAFQEV